MSTSVRPRPGRLLVAVLLGAALTALTACGAAPVNTPTIEQATQQLQSYFQAAHAAITTTVPDATLEPRREPLVGQCGPPHGTAPCGQEFVGYSNLLRGFPTERNPDIYAAVEGFWAPTAGPSTRMVGPRNEVCTHAPPTSTKW